MLADLKPHHLSTDIEKGSKRIKQILRNFCVAKLECPCCGAKFCIDCTINTPAWDHQSRKLVRNIPLISHHHSAPPRSWLGYFFSRKIKAGHASLRNNWKKLEASF